MAQKKCLDCGVIFIRGQGNHKFCCELCHFNHNIMISPDECFVWIGSKHNSGYGFSIFNGDKKLAHRRVYAFFNGELNDDLEIMHTCDNPLCVNPDHLIQDTHTANMQDMLKKGRNKPNIVFGKKRYQLTDEQVLSIATSDETFADLALTYNVTESYISRIKWGRSYQDVSGVTQENRRHYKNYKGAY